MTGFDNNINEKYDYAPFIKACQKAASFDLFRCSSGNMSWRLDDKHIALSASRSWLADLTFEQIAVCRISDGTCINSKKPTVEVNFHLGIMQNRTDVNVVLHFQSQCATAVACGNPSDYNFNIIPEIPFNIDKVAIVEYLQPGSTELAESVIEKMKKHNMVIMRNHGLVTVGKDFDDAIQKAVFFELACSILLAQPNPVHISDS
jgi:ribulose-5-phosphate 4-epimerase/fuculose-1-phosphate aldolase